MSKSSDLLTFCAGFGFVMAPPGTYPIQKAESDLKLMTLSPPIPGSPLTPDEWMRRFSTLPLMHQPGEQWMYNTSAHLLGVTLLMTQRAWNSPNPPPVCQDFWKLAFQL